MLHISKQLISTAGGIPASKGLVLKIVGCALLTFCWNRAIKACHECRTRKSKCDMNVPKCHDCRTHQRECIYITDRPDTMSQDSVSRSKREARHIESKRFNLPRPKSGELRFLSHGNNFQDNDSTECCYDYISCCSENSWRILHLDGGTPTCYNGGEGKSVSQ